MCEHTSVSRWTKYLVIPTTLVAVLVATSFAAAAYTGRTSFCISCHEMQPYYDSWQQSQHTEAGCAECHIPKGVVGFLKTKAFAFREVYVHVVHQVKVPLAVTREIPDSNCAQCHDSLPPAQAAPASADAPFDHAQHSEPCVECHVRMVHESVTPPVYVDPSTMAACFVCHDGAVAEETCALCHTAPHDDMGACETCHGLEDWVPSGFDHPFPLEFAHATAACVACHTKATAPDGSSSFGGASPACDSCHDAPHDDYGVCNTCHVTESWAPSGFEHTFGGASPECVSWHRDEHGGLNDCDRCHSPQGWTPASFSHPGVGEHIPGGEHRLACGECHPSGFGSATCAPCHNGAPGGD